MGGAFDPPMQNTINRTKVFNMIMVDFVAIYASDTRSAIYAFKAYGSS